MSEGFGPMNSSLSCARCASGNHPSSRFCGRCGLPLGSVQADAGAGEDALDAYESAEPSEVGVDADGLVRDLVARAGFEATPSRSGWRLVVPLPMDRRQAVYVGPGGTDAEGRPLLAFVSVCGPANDRDARILLKMNARAVEGHHAIKVLRGEEYFVVTHNLAAPSSADVDAHGLIRRIAEAADGLEDRLSRGRDLY